jgi:hypothetical protein
LTGGLYALLCEERAARAKAERELKRQISANAKLRKSRATLKAQFDRLRVSRACERERARKVIAALRDRVRPELRAR